MPSYDEFNKWLLSQLKDPELLERAKQRMKKSVVWDVSDVEGSTIAEEEDVISPSPVSGQVTPKNREEGNKRQTPEESANFYIEKRTYEPDGFWLEKLFPNRNNHFNEEESLINTGTKLVYEHMASFANMLAYHKRNPWKLIGEEEAQFEGVFLSPVLLQRLYYYSRDLVLTHYNPDEVGSTSSSYLHYFNHAFGQVRTNALVNLGNRLLETLPEIDAQTYEYFGYTALGEKRVWWDREGTIRRQHPVTEKQMNRFQVEPLRMTFIWAIEPLKIRILAMYDRVCDYLEELIQQGDENWRNLTMKRYITSVVSGDRHHNNPKRYDLMGILLRRCEIKVRDAIEGFPQLSVSDDEEELQRRLPQVVREPLKAMMENYVVPDLNVDDLALICNETRYGVKVANAWLDERKVSDRELLSLLDQLDEKTANRILVHQSNRLSDNLQRLNIFLQWRKNHKLVKIQKYDVSKLFNDSQNSRLEDWIQTEPFPEGLSEFRTKFLKEEEVKRSLFRKENIGKKLFANGLWASYVALILQALQEPRFRKVKLDFDKVNASRVSLAKTVQLVDDFMKKYEDETGEEEKQKESLLASEQSETELPVAAEEVETVGEIVQEEEEVEVSESDEEATENLWTSEERALLLALLESEGGVSRADLATFAKEAGLPETVFIGQINNKAFDDIGAELLFFEDGHLIVDDWDRDWLRESLETEERSW